MRCRLSASRTLGPEAYSEWRASEVGVVTDALEAGLMVELAGDVAGCDVLDVGCGDGAFALDLYRRGARVTGLDPSAAMIAAARRRAGAAGADISFVLGAAERLPFRDRSFDLVTAITVLCFVEDAAPVFREMARTLRPGGHLVIGELGKWSPWAAQRRLRGWFGSRLWRRAYFRTSRELRMLAAGAGLVVEAIRGAVFYPRVALAARLLARYDSRLGRLTTVGAAFLALAAVKPGQDAPGAGGTRGR